MSPNDLLKDVEDPKYYFHLYNGKTLKNIRDLIDALKVMDQETFRHHVNEGRNDFANWIRDVLKDDHLALKIVHLENRKSIIVALEKAINPMRGLNHIGKLREKYSKKKIITKIPKPNKSYESNLNPHRIQHKIFSDFFVGMAVGIVSTIIIYVIYYLTR